MLIPKGVKKMSTKPEKSKSGKLKLKKTTAKDLNLGDKAAEKLRGGRACANSCGPCTDNTCGATKLF